MNIALLTAAGGGTRMKQDIPKQFIHIDNKPIIIYTLEVFQQNPSVDKIIVVTLESWIDVLRAYEKCEYYKVNDCKYFYNYTKYSSNLLKFSFFSIFRYISRNSCTKTKIE